MKKVRDYIQSFESWWDKPAKCRIRVYVAAESPSVIICTELPENQESIFTMTEWLSTEIWQQEGQPIPFIWIEHCSARTILPAGETFHKIVFTQPPNRFHMPGGEFIRLGEVKTLVGEWVE